ncbi:pimeloyl-[acyl-carrier protein] methyl ester esterase-like [Macadamia integrifolia]|uniref:pimeloyl-[acyl-carrier protein] methyl ester esterase-like n=1 Tax=Macadamia integrifolia TaxID=60698 RepID=UPI001C4ED2D4|nr:pimeloyl-[acyl-carrier protein] methyl ester esterase-like [Macadamia integrifolia]
MAASRLSLVSLYGRYISRKYKLCGLSPATVEVDSETTIHFWGPKPNSPSTGKPSLVLIHGFGPSSLFQWQHQVRPLSDHFDLYVPDLVFFGGSTTNSSDRSEIFQAVSIAKLLDKLGLNRFSVMGTSYGGMVAYHMASMWPEKVEKVVIASSAVNMVRKDQEEVAERGGVERIEDLLLPRTSKQLRKLFRLMVFKRSPVLPDFLLNNLLRTLFAENRGVKLELLKGMIIGRDDMAHVSSLKEETLIVWGEHDQIFPLKKAIELKGLLGGKVQLEVLKKTSHIPQIENPKQFNAIVKKFLC